MEMSTCGYTIPAAVCGVKLARLSMELVGDGAVKQVGRMAPDKNTADSVAKPRDPLEWSVFRLILLCVPTDQLLVRVIQRCTNSMSEGSSLLVAVK